MSTYLSLLDQHTRDTIMNMVIESNKDDMMKELKKRQIWILMNEEFHDQVIEIQNLNDAHIRLITQIQTNPAFIPIINVINELNVTVETTATMINLVKKMLSMTRFKLKNNLKLLQKYLNILDQYSNSHCRCEYIIQLYMIHIGALNHFFLDEEMANIIGDMNNMDNTDILRAMSNILLEIINELDNFISTSR